jgi:hypothetical protein
MREVVCGILGGLIGDLVFLLDQRRQTEPLPFLRTTRYWFSLAGLGVVGGFVVWAYQGSGVEFSTILAFQVGISAPLIIKHSAASIPALGPGSRPPGGAPP